MQESSSQQYGSGSASKARRADKGILPVTIKQLLSASQEAQDDAYLVDGRECTQVTLVALITNVQEQSTCITYDLEDTTGKIQARMWLDADESEFMVRSRREWTPGAYVRVVGNMKSQQGVDQRSLTAFHLRKVKDFNELTYHLLDCCHVHLYNTKGPMADAKPSGSMGMPSNFQSPSKPYAPQPQQNGSMAVNGSAGGGGEPVTDVKSAVHEILKTPTSNEQGYSIDDVMAVLQQRGGRAVDKKDVRAVIDQLSMEGMAYSTIDEEHFTST